MEVVDVTITKLHVSHVGSTDMEIHLFGNTPNGYMTPMPYLVPSCFLNTFEYLWDGSVGAFPRTVGMDPSDTLISNSSVCMEAYEYLFWQVLTQRLLGMFE